MKHNYIWPPGYHSVILSRQQVMRRDGVATSLRICKQGPNTQN